ncbi:flagellar motor protein MotB [Jannaschia ovalis]|uniref:Flagellar motor protein MotB n=1 Tax=Jannaschia ovalis TaxID=3038773 RepID=A0ABY8L8V2_9RHOB|nr:flagellar motor protein MotB [Jannaschia sp. GRR-S6-38]WGH77721.1 flagellar motor protein MotB [Jannaschia sp. GRR-S6-38]
MPGENARPIIIKKIKKVSGGGHHGGAWKVAYADFVTAMMAFFMLMWLLNATTEKQRKGLADYFSPTVAISRASGGGDGAMGGTSMMADAALVQVGRGGITSSATHGTTLEEAEFRAVEAALLGKGGDSLLDEEQLRHVTVRLSDEGLVIEFFDLPDRPLFEDNRPSPLLRGLLASVAPEVANRRNALAIDAHTAAEPVVTREPRAWSRSAARADAMRLILPEIGVADRRIARLTGHADRRPAAANPLSPRNNRVELTLLRGGR